MNITRAQRMIRDAQNSGRYTTDDYKWLVDELAKLLESSEYYPKQDLLAECISVLRQHRRCGDAYPEDGWPEVNAVLAHYALFMRGKP